MRIPSFFVGLLGCLSTAFVLAADAPSDAKPAVPHNTLTQAEIDAGWKLLFDGKTSTGWRKLGAEAFPAEGWTVKDGTLHHAAGKGGGDIIFDQKFENFELSFEWMIPKPNGNSGIKYRVQETKGKGAAYGCEYQCMNDPGKTDKSSTGSLYDVLPTNPEKVFKAPPEWNHSRIIIQGNHGEHWLNGVKTVEWTFGSDEFKAAVAKSKFGKNPAWAADPKGYIAITDHGDESSWRNIKIRELPAK